MNKHPYSSRAIPSWEMAITLSFIYDRFGRELFSWYVGEKHVGLDKKMQASQKEHVLSLQRFCQLSTRSFASLIPDSRSFNFPPTFACSLIAVFSLLVRFFRFFELVHGHFHCLGLFIPKIITPKKMLAWWLLNWEASSSHLYNPVKVVLVDCITSQLQGCQSVVNFYFRRKCENAISPPKFSLFQ